MMSEITPEVIDYVKDHKLDLLLNSEIMPVEKSIYESVDPKVVAPKSPEWDDLVRLHKIVRSRKVTTVLEFGCGYSTVIFADAIQKNQQEFGDFVASNLRRSNPFEVHSVDDMAKYIKITRSILPKNLKSCVKFTKSEVLMTTFGGRICTEYSNLPNICPDFIYLDAPSQDSAKGEISGISTRHPDRLPMSCDLLKIEHFLLPGTIILVDGRTANARFLRTNLQRNWLYQHDVLNDAHVFELVEAPLGRYNKAQIEFCLGKNWFELVKTN
ncbi:MAG: hypothetical protein NT119_03980 [Actinobacteria bacterium]|nr:hypothetical protein [Actinomycetota bacterium]